MTDWLTEWLAGSSAEWALFVSAFVSDTLFPGGSEVLLAGALAAGGGTERMLRLILIAAAGNTLGGMTSWVIGRFVPNRTEDGRAASWLRRFGAPVLFFSWVPVVGDAIPLAAGWLRIGWLPALFWIGLGKLVRYLAVSWATLSLL